MSLEQVKGVADAVLYEGYILYPYRPSSIKNRQRWTFGGVFPQAFAGRQGDACMMQTQVLLRGGADATIDVHVRFLQVIERSVGRLVEPLGDWPLTSEPAMTFVSRLEVAGRDYTAWDEAVEREVALKNLFIEDVARMSQGRAFSFSSSRELEPVRGAGGRVVAALVRTGMAIEGVVEIVADRLGADLMRLSVRIENTTPLSPQELVDRDQAQRRAFVATHTIFELRGGALSRCSIRRRSCAKQRPDATIRGRFRCLSACPVRRMRCCHRRSFSTTTLKSRRKALANSSMERKSTRS